MLDDIIEFVDNEDGEGVIIFVDLQKSFDRMEWGWLNYAMHTIVEIIRSNMTIVYRGITFLARHSPFNEQNYSYGSKRIRSREKYKRK
jgi:hypothetical protein